MDDLDKQLAELQLINKAELLPNPNVNRGQVSARKIAPAVPPKPKKQPPQPQVPYSHKVQTSGEPLYSSRLSNASPATQFYSNLPPPPAPPSSQSYHQNTYANVGSQQQQPLHHYQQQQQQQQQRYNLPSSRSSYANSEIDNASNMRASNLSLASNSNISMHSGLPPASSVSSGPKPYWKSSAQPACVSHISAEQQHAATNFYSNVTPQQPYYHNNPHHPIQHHLIYSNLANPPPSPPVPSQQQYMQQTRTYGNLPLTPQQQQPYGTPPTASGELPPPYGPSGDDLPPPPPPPELDGSGFANYAPCIVNTSMPPPPDDLPPPPSPVSSSYSELRRATHPEPDYQPNYSIDSQTSSTYESIYEPINPRPPSQLSSRSNYSIYGPYGGSTASGPSQSASRVGMPKERDVDTLTNLLVSNMHNQMDPEFYGICFKCDKKVVGENSGCTAMDKIYHTACFTCHHCAVNLQGKPFYALNGKPYCEEDYLNTLEKCCVCTKPILDRILRATGKPYHPKCFCCVICGKSLDGIPFTVDSTNQIHCIEDFHKKFAPRCCVCKEPIMPEPGQEETVRVVALDRSFHIQCYKCEDCGLVLSSEAEGRGCYPLDDHVLCKSCNAKRVQALTMHMTTEL